MTAKMLPNTFSSFNDYVDVAMELLTPEEYKVLSFAARHILGWQDKINKRRGSISLTMFEHGYTTPDGVHFGGTGLGRGALLKALAPLEQAHLLIKIGKASPEGQQWELGMEADWDFLRARRAGQGARNRERTEKARLKKQTSRPIDPVQEPQVVSPTNQQAVSPTNQQVVSPTNRRWLVPQTGAGLSDIPKQNHSQKQVVVVEETTTPTELRASNSEQERGESSAPAPTQRQADFWMAAFHQLEMQLDRASFDTWLRGAELLGVERDEAAGEVFVVGVRNQFAQDMLQHRLYRSVRRVLSDVYGQSVELRFEVREPVATTADVDTEMPLFRVLAAQPSTLPEPAPETIRDLFARFIAPITSANESAVQLVEQQHAVADFSYALTVMAAAQARGRVNDPLAYTLGILRNQR